MSETAEQLLQRTREHVLSNIDKFERCDDAGHPGVRYTWRRYYYLTFDAHIGAKISIYGSKAEIPVDRETASNILSKLRANEEWLKLQNSRYALEVALEQTEAPRPTLWQRIFGGR